MGSSQSKADINETIFPNETAISISPEVVNQLSNHLQSFNVTPVSERQSNLDAHIRSRIQAELEHLRKEEVHIRQEIESVLEKESLNRERAMTDDVNDTNASATGAVKSSAALSEDLEQIRFKIDRFHAPKDLERYSEVEKINQAVLSCYRFNKHDSLDCRRQVRLFNDAVTLLEEEYLKMV